jgi:Sec-independent protein translocase protein TatA
MISFLEIGLILGVLCILYFFGNKKVREWAKTLGSLKKEYNNGKNQ